MNNKYVIASETKQSRTKDRDRFTAFAMTDVGHNSNENMVTSLRGRHDRRNLEHSLKERDRFTVFAMTERKFQINKSKIQLIS